MSEGQERATDFIADIRLRSSGGGFTSDYRVSNEDMDRITAILLNYQSLIDNLKHENSKLRQVLDIPKEKPLTDQDIIDVAQAVWDRRL